MTLNRKLRLVVVIIIMCSQGVAVVNLVVLNLVVHTSMLVETVVLGALGVADGVVAGTFSGRFIYNN